LKSCRPVIWFIFFEVGTNLFILFKITPPFNSYWSRFKSWSISIRYRPIFFDQDGHQTTYASLGNKYFSTKLHHHQTYQNYEQGRKNWAHVLVKYSSQNKIRKIRLIFDAKILQTLRWLFIILVGLTMT